MDSEFQNGRENMLKKILAAAIVLFALTACNADLGSGIDIPKPFRDKIVTLHADELSLNHKCADLQRQIAEMNAQVQWDQGQMSSIAIEAMNSIGYSNEEYIVDVQKMKIISRKKK